jgi:cation transport regulator ChaC
MTIDNITEGSGSQLERLEEAESPPYIVFGYGSLIFRVSDVEKTIAHSTTTTTLPH